eukprot:COSAG02_NODE_2329_length_9121_cov_3.015183_2_plen_111_part_00
MAAEVTRARGAQTSRLQALRTLRHNHDATDPASSAALGPIAAPTLTTPAASAAAAAAAHSHGLSCEAPLACVLPLQSGDRPVARVVPSPSGQSATVIFADSTAEVHKLLG